MKSKLLLVRNSLLLSAALLAFCGLRADAQARPVARISESIDETNRVQLKGNTHPLARAEFDQGVVADSQPMNRILLLLKRSPEQEAALQKLLDEQQMKDSPNYHKWLTPAAFGAQFGPADADIQAVKDWLAAQGFQNVKIGTGRTAIEFSGTAGQVRSAFGTEIHGFQVNGEAHMANMSDPQIPAALTPVVAGPVSLHNFRKKSFVHYSQALALAQARGSQVRPGFTAGTGTFAVGPGDFAKIYNLPAALDGTNQTIAIVARSNIKLSDIHDFRNGFGLPVNDPQIILNGPDPGSSDSGEEGEADLDAEWSGAVAPKAKILFVVSESTASDDGVDLSAFYIVDNNLAPVMSESFGTCEAGLTAAGNQFQNALWEQAAAQGITVFVSSGDNGSAGCDAGNAAISGLAVSGTASTPFNVSVGGTDFDDATNAATFWNTTNDPTTKASAKSYIPETTWNSSCASAGVSGCTTVKTNGLDLTAGSGGPSNCATFTPAGACAAGYPKPTWQVGPGVPADGVRDTPDVSLFAAVNSASNNFYIMCQAASGNQNGKACNLAGPTFTFTGVGGTSASTPAFAAIMALINQSELAAGRSGRQGNANPVLYKIAASAGQSCNSSTEPVSGSTCAFNDITKGNIAVACVGGKPNCSNTTAGGNGVLIDPKNTSNPAWVTTAGYDVATGLGSVNVTNLVTQWGNTTGGFVGSQTALAAKVGGVTVAAINVAHGTAVSFTTTVTPTVGTGTPTGDISLIGSPSSGLPGIDSGTLSGGTVTFSSTFLPGGTYNLEAHYAGDGAFGPSDSSPPIRVTISAEASRAVPSLVTFSSSGAATCNASGVSASYGSPYVFRVDINTTGTLCADITTKSAPTGTVTLTDNGNNLDGGTFTLNSLGYFEDQPIQLPPGAHSIVAAYSGDGSYLTNTAGAFAVTVTQATTSTTVTSSVSSIASGGSVTLTATVATNSNGAGPTGTVQFKNGSSTLSTPVTCTPTAGTGTTAASCTATLTTALSFLAPRSVPRQMPRTPFELLWIVAWALLVIFLLNLRRLPAGKRLGYACAGVMLFACLGAGISGCSGGSSSSPPFSTTHTDSITAVYSGDTNYTASTSAAVSITVQ